MHPELFELKALVAGRLDAHRRREIDDHLGSCAECSRHYVAMMIGSSSPKTAEAESRQAAAPVRAGAQMLYAGVADGPPLSASYGIDAPLAPSVPRPAPRPVPQPSTMLRESDVASSSHGRTRVPVSASLVDAITRLRAESDANALAPFVTPRHTPIPTAAATVAPLLPAAPVAAAEPVLRVPAFWSDEPVVADTPIARPEAINKVLPLGPRAGETLSAPAAALPESLPPLPAFSFAEYDDVDPPAATLASVTTQAPTPAPTAGLAPEAAPALAPAPVPALVRTEPTPLTYMTPLVMSVMDTAIGTTAPDRGAAAKPELVVTFSATPTPTRRSSLRNTGLKATATFVPTFVPTLVSDAVAVPTAPAITKPVEEHHVARTLPGSGMQPARLAAVLGTVAVVFVLGMSGYRYFQTSVSTAASAAAAAAAKQVQATAQASAQAQAQRAAGAAAAVAPAAPAVVQTRIVYIREPAKAETRTSASPDTQPALPPTPVTVIFPDVNVNTPSMPDNASLSATQRSATSELTRGARATTSRTVSRP